MILAQILLVLAQRFVDEYHNNNLKKIYISVHWRKSTLYRMTCLGSLTKYDL